MGSRHPRVESIVQEQIRKAGAYNSALRRSCYTGHHAPILHLSRSFQPALDVEKHPRTARMFADRFEQQLPIDAVEVALHVDVERPVISPASLTSRPNGIDRRPAGSVSVGVP